MPAFNRGDITLYAERRGAGPPLLFIHGTGSDLRARPNGFDLPFAAEFDLTCYDHRGLGQSARPRDGESWSMADYGDDAAAVMDWAGWEQAAVVGVSFGGMVTQELLIRHPDRVSRAVLCCTSSGGAGASSYPLHELADLAPADRAAAMVRIIDTRWSEAGAGDPLYDYLLKSMSAAPPADAGARAQLAARATHDSWDRLPQIDVPVLICAGEYDGIAPLANSEALNRQIPHSLLEVFEGGHGFLYQDVRAPELIRDFLLAD
ncbi:MAG TPA: alpha/beta fold hydrolase [Mycobacteriales bacterium]|nr:alpha/beta fold hydrolase [Mycobacteriales bacterium]